MPPETRPHDHLIQLLPQRPPFLFVDHVLEVDPLRRAKGSVLFAEGHWVFENHLPGDPLVPGVILIEALAQLAGIVFVGEGAAPLKGYLGEVTRMRFHRRVEPGDEVILEGDLVQAFGPYARFHGRASVRGELVAEGELILARSSS